MISDKGGWGWAIFILFFDKDGSLPLVLPSSYLKLLNIQKVYVYLLKVQCIKILFTSKYVYELDNNC